MFNLPLSFEVLVELRSSLHAIEFLSSVRKRSPVNPEPVHRVKSIRKLITEMTFIQPVKPFFHNIFAVSCIWYRQSDWEHFCGV